MASSGSITTNEVEGRSVTLSWTLSSQSIEKIPLRLHGRFRVQVRHQGM